MWDLSKAHTTIASGSRACTSGCATGNTEFSFRPRWSWNERGAAIPVGTMSLIRRRALEEAGGWSEWCLTEDSELAPRIHARGYSSVYVGETFGRGLIPETFAGYAKQRRRWTYGPIQELKRHLPMFVPSPLRAKTALTPGQKLFHLHHDLDPLFNGLAMLLLLGASCFWPHCYSTGSDRHSGRLSGRRAP